MNARKSLESKRVTNERSSALLTNSTLQSNIQANDSQKVLENPERTIQAIDRRTKKATEVNNELRCSVMCGDPNTSLIASILWYYQTYSELREKINADPSENIVDYLVDLDRLDDIVKCFKSIKILDEEKRVIEFSGIRHLTPSPITNRRKSICKSMLLEPDVTPNQNLSVNNSSSPRPFSSDQETNNYKTLLDALYVLLLHDFDLLFYVFSDEYKALILPKLVKSPLHYMQQEAQRLCTDIQQLSHKIDTEKFAFYGLFSIIRWFHKSENMFNKIYDENFLAPEHHFEIILSAIFENSIVECLNAILGEVQNDSSPLSQRRSVHPLMLNVLSFMEGLFEYRDVISHKRFSRSPNIVDSSSEEKYLFNLENFFSDLIKNLLENIMKKMNTLIPYNERMGRTIFLLNNTNYLLKQLESSPLLVMIENKQPNIRAQLKETVQKCVQTYRKCYTPFTMTIREMLNNPSVKHFSDNPLKEGDREVLKASFTKVNEIIDTLRNQNQQYTVDDAHQRHYLRTESKKKVLEPFKTYYNQFAHIDFTQNSEKYKRYNPPMLESIIDSFFEH
ncbi:unnamed protein product [Rotaria magnacalcarata]|uniref:Exocyst complex component 7 n=1 Tax=Rotaria magnacalcarata TaxID=392030 RepID=A0A8S2NU95_9BILA|nr:unnamed protein product [Rotaria magnacalcarata]